MRFTLEPGRYYAGIDRPWFVSDAAVRDALAQYGIKRVSFTDRTKRPPPVAFPPSGDWDEWVEVEYDGPAQTIDTTKHWAWLVYVPFKASLPGRRPLPVSPPAVPLSAYLPIGVVPTSIFPSA